VAELADAPDLKPYITFFFLPLKLKALSLKPLSGVGLSAVYFQLTTTRYKLFLDSFGRKSGKKVQNARLPTFRASGPRIKRLSMTVDDVFEVVSKVSVESCR
jgi:hypothetical protein